MLIHSTTPKWRMESAHHWESSSDLMLCLARKQEGKVNLPLSHTEQQTCKHTSYSHISYLKFHLHSNWIQAIITDWLYLLWYIVTGWERGTTGPRWTYLCLWLCRERDKWPPALFDFNEVGTEGFLSIPLLSPRLSSSFTATTTLISSLSIHPQPFPCLWPRCRMVDKNTGWKRNSPLVRCEVWSGNFLTHAVSQAKRRSPGWG